MTPSKLIVSRILPFVLCVLSSAGVAISGAQIDSEATHDLVVARNQVVDYARDIKSKFQESDPVWQGARDRYRKAYSEFSAYLAIVKSAIRTGKTKDLQKDPIFQTAAEEASNCGKEFIRFVQLKTATRTRDVALIGMLFSQGTKIYNGIQAGKAERREQLAIAFEKDLMWPRWEDIK